MTITLTSHTPSKGKVVWQLDPAAIKKLHLVNRRWHNKDGSFRKWVADLFVDDGQHTYGPINRGVEVDGRWVTWRGLVSAIRSVRGTPTSASCVPVTEWRRTKRTSGPRTAIDRTVIWG